MIVTSICELNLHDSEILQIMIVNDEVVIALDYIEDYETMKCSRRRLIFRGCTQANFRINPNDASPNSIQFGMEAPLGNQRKVQIETNKIVGAIEILATEIELI